MADVATGRPVWALGLMSGTSMDGVDAARILTDGESIAALPAGEGFALPYPEPLRAAIAAVEGWAPAAETETLLDHWHAQAALALGPSAVVGYHGQTVAHEPERGRTRQLGDGARLASALGTPVVWDFRSADMAAGGEGAPLAPFFHWALARWIGAKAPVAFLNIGGVSNVTWVDPAAEAPEAEGALLAFDTGPGNALVDDFMRARVGLALDEDGALAGAGTVRSAVAPSNAASVYLARPGPKSLDRNAFQGVRAGVEALSVEDGAATLTAFTADCVAAALPHLPSPPSRWLVCGGGRLNKTLMGMLAERLDAPVEPVDTVGLDGDMLEAQAFAYLAVRVLRGLPTSAPGTTGCRHPVCGGRINQP